MQREPSFAKVAKKNTLLLLFFASFAFFAEKLSTRNQCHRARGSTAERACRACRKAAGSRRVRRDAVRAQLRVQCATLPVRDRAPAPRRTNRVCRSGPEPRSRNV